MTQDCILRKRSCPLCCCPGLLILGFLFLLDEMQKLTDPDIHVEAVDGEGRRLLAEPDGGIGLQACRLEVADGSLFGQAEGQMTTFQAGDPWWV